MLRNCWYVALPSRKLKPGQCLGKKMLGEPLVVGRHADGRVFALRDICPHRGMPLRHGRLEDEGLRCCYHGWKFDTRSGRCCEIPSLTPESSLEPTRIKVLTYPCEEVQGHVWIYFAATGAADPPPVPKIQSLGDLTPNVAETAWFNCDVDQAIIGLMDPAHGPYVHTAWWWRSGPRQFRIKEKQYEPTPLGFRLAPYTMPASAKPYKVLGKQVSIEIVFELPGLRTEILLGDRDRACVFTAVTPVDEHHTEVHQSLYWTVPVLTLLTPLMRRLTMQFLNQDREVVVKQQEGLAYNPPLMLIDDADTQAKWYYQLKQEYEQSQRQNRPFQHPLKPQVLRWRS